MEIIIKLPSSINTRVLQSIDIMGYVFDPESTLTNEEQRLQFVTNDTVAYWQSNIFNYERGLAIANEPNDTAADQAQRWDNAEGLQGESVPYESKTLEL